MKAQLERIFRAGLAACQPAAVLPAHLPPPAPGRNILLAFGKAAGSMALAAEQHYGEGIEGIAVVPHGVRAELQWIAAVHAGHPLPDSDSVEAAERLLALAASARAGDRVLVLLSGGASSLACLPGEGLALAAMQTLTDELLRSGAGISDINCVRRHLSRFKGGRLARAVAGAELLTLAISDVEGGRPEDIGSGPTVADPTTIGDASDALRRLGIAAPSIGWSESPKAVAGEFRIVADAQTALDAAAGEAERLGFAVERLGEAYGAAAETGRNHAARALGAAPGTALISGGELGARVVGGGRGGRNQDYALAAAIAIAGRADISGLAADSDGIDGNGIAAGAFFDGTSLARSDRDPAEAQATSDSGGFFAALCDHFVTGPTGTNVNDLRILLVAPKGGA